MAINPQVQRGRQAQPGATFAMQAKSSSSDETLASMYMCSRCAIRYTVTRGDKAKCPLCEVEKKLTQTNLALAKMHEENATLKRKVEALGSLMDHVTAIREAMQLVEGDDMVFLKQVMYLYRDDRSYTLTALNGRISTDRRGRIAKKQPVRNALLLTKGGREPEEHVFTSIGGVAIVGYFDEMTREIGEKQAMTYLLRGVSLYLTKAE